MQDILTAYQIGKLKHCFGLDYARRPYRNYYYCNKPNNEWNDLCKKGYGALYINDAGGYIYSGTLKALKLVYRKNVTKKYFEAIDK